MRGTGDPAAAACGCLWALAEEVDMSRQQIEQVLEMASRSELEAHGFYRSVAAKMANPDVRRIFEQLARDEMGHYELIERYRHDPKAGLKIAAPVGDWKVAEGEALPELSTNAKPKDAIALAMKKEQQAVELYRALASSSSDAGVRSTFENLANMELGHKRKLETAFVDIGYPEVF